MAIKAVIFDLDGVLTDTANFHYQAWKVLSDELGMKFDENMNEKLKGVSRRRSFEIILEENKATERYAEEEIKAFIEKKNCIYKEFLQKITPKDILPGICTFLTEAKKKGIKLAVASASQNASTVLDKLELTQCFDYVADAAKIKHAKPDPEIFSICANALNVLPKECIGIEDSQAGIEAIKAAGMIAVGIGVTVSSIQPDINYKDTVVMKYKEVMSEIRDMKQE